MSLSHCNHVEFQLRKKVRREKSSKNGQSKNGTCKNWPLSQASSRSFTITHLAIMPTSHMKTRFSSFHSTTQASQPRKFNGNSNAITRPCSRFPRSRCGSKGWRSSSSRRANSRGRWVSVWSYFMPLTRLVDTLVACTCVSWRRCFPLEFARRLELGLHPSEPHRDRGKRDHGLAIASKFPLNFRG